MPWYRTFWAPTIGIILVAGVIVAASLLAVPFAARHTTSHDPIIIGAPATEQLR